jgi:hypothetical protein
MATEKHPYTSGSGHISQIVVQLRKAFPPVVNAETLKKFEIAPNNETYILNILKFLKIIDSEGKKNAVAAPLFHKNDDEFEPGFAKLVREAYAEVFDTYGEDAWNTPSSKLIAFFRTHDDTSEVVGTRQANTFRALAKLGGKVSGDATPATPKPKAAVKAKSATKKSAPTVAAPTPAPAAHSSAPATAAAAGKGQHPSGMALTVRVEINLPPGGDQAIYDAIFKSIRENLLNGNAA